jgi:Rieske Fe-S protein
MSQDAMSRRTVIPGLAVTAVAGVAGFAVAKNTDAAKPAAAAGPSTPAGGGGSGAAAGGATPLATLADLPTGGGVVLAGDQIVLTRDAGGDVHGFSAVCTHQGCTVNSVQQGVIACPCHGSRFDGKTGAPVAGPAKKPLPPVAVVVRDDAVFRA